MSLPPQLLEHKTLMIAQFVLTRRIAEALEVDPYAPVAELCRALGANRTSVYEQLSRASEHLEELANTQPGRPAAEPGPAAGQDETACLQLTIEVLDYRLKQPGAVVEHRDRTGYADIFRRFILQRRDRFGGTLTSFAQAVRVPLDTLRDWCRHDGIEALQAPQAKERPPLPVKASELTREIVEEWMRWVGPTRAFLGHAAQLFGLSPKLIAQLMKVLTLIKPRHRKAPRYRGSTQLLSPGTMLVTDGKWITVKLLDSEQTLYLNWQGIVDQTTGCDTATVITEQEDAAAVREAYERSVQFLGGLVPDALLHDNKPCYEEGELQEALQDAGTHMLPATSGRPENKAIIEGAFGLYEQRVGTLHLDDTDDESFVRSAVREILRAYTAATNSVPRAEFDGKSRLRALQEACPTAEQRQRDEAFLQRLKANHSRAPRRPQPDPQSLALIEHVFERFQLLDHDPKGHLRSYLATFQPEAIRRAAAILAAKIERRQIERRYAHRYLTKVVRSQQDELDLERAAEELLELTRRQNQDWVASEEQLFQSLAEDRESLEDLTSAVAERAAFGGLPLQATFWTSKLLELLREHAAHLVEAVKKQLIRLYEAPKQQRLVLLDLITAQQQGLA